MSKNLTRKGLAFGALVALAASVISGAPASADNGQITLLPNGGAGTNATFNSIIGAGITLTATLNPSVQGATTGVAATLEGPAALGSYIITNAGGAKITVSSASPDAFGYLVYDADGNTAAPASAGSATLTTGTTLESSNDYNWASSAVVDATKAYVDVSAASLTTTATKILVRAAKKGTANSGASDDIINPIKIDAAGTSTVTLTVQSLTDTEAAAADTTGKVGSFENNSAVQTVTLYPVGAVSTTTTITSLQRTALSPATATDVDTQAEQNEFGFVAKTVYNNSINPYAVAGSTKVQLRKDGGDPIYLNVNDGDTALTTQVNAFPFASASVLSSTRYFKTTSATAAAPGTTTTAGLQAFAAGVYAAQVIFSADSFTTSVAVGASSPVVDLSDGQNATVDAVDGYLTADKNTAFATNAATVRTGTKATTLVAQIQASSASLEASNVQVKATFSADKLSATSATTISGAATGLAKTGDSVVAYGRTDSKGLVNFAISNAGAVAGDKLTAVIGVLKSNGTWTAAETVTITWAAADLKSFEAKPGAYVSGANPTVTFLTKDQFGEAIDVDSDASLSVTAVASIAGVEKPATFSKTVAVSAGKVVFTFANFATAGSSAQLVASLKAGASAATPSTGSASITVNVYNSLGTDKIAVVDSFEKAITYKDFVTGDSTDAAVAAKLLKVNYAGGDYQTITGTVTNVNGSGQPGIAVEVSGAGLLFKADTTYATDKVTAYANEYGVFTVDVFSHVVNVKGIKVSFAADGKTASTLLKTKLPTSITDANLAFSWKLPAMLIKNTTYAVTAKLADKWGNPVAAADSTNSAYAVRFQGTGSVEVNSSSAAVDKEFDKNGSVTVFVRSVKDIAGPGSVSATLGTAWDYPTALIGTKTNAGTIDAYETVDDTATAWDETAWSNELSSSLEILDKKPTASVAAASKAASVVVKNAEGLTVTVVSGTKSVTKIATSDSFKVSLTKLTAGKKTVKVYVNDVLVSSKSVTVKK